MSSNTNIGNTPVNQGYVQLIHTGETGGIDGTLRTLYDGDGTASDLQIASNKVKISTELYIGSKTITEYVQDVVGDMFDTNGSHTNITATYDDAGDGAIDLVATGAISGLTEGTGVTITGTTNKTIAIGQSVGTSDTVSFGRVNLGSTDNSDFLTGNAKISSTGYMMIQGIVNETETGTAPAAIVFGNNSTYGNDEISLITNGLNRLFIANGGNITISQDLTISGDLQVNGTTTTVNQTNLDVSDNIIGLNRGASTNANDSGLIIERGSTGDNVFIGWDESLDRIRFATTTADASSTGNLSLTNANIHAGRLYADVTGDLTGDVTGNVTGNLTGNVTGNVTGSASLNLLISNNLSDLASASHARTNLGVDAAGTDNSTDVTLVTTSHDYLSISGQAITLGSIDISDDTNLVGGTGITLTGDTLSTTDSEIVHDNLSGFVENEHKNHANIEIASGAGLTGGGDITATRTLAVGAGTGITVNADDIEVDFTNLTLANSADAANDQLLFNDSGVGLKKILIEDLPFSNNAGTVTSIATGTGISGGPITTSGTLSLALSDVIANNSTANVVLTSDGDGTLTGETELTYTAGTLKLERATGNAVFRIQSNDSNPRIYFNEGSTTRANLGYSISNNRFELYADGNTPFSIEDGAGSDTLVVDSNSRVGIGTAGPGRQLTVYGEGVIRLDSASADPGIDFNTAGTSDMQFRYRAATDKLQIYSYGTSTNVATIQKSDGFLGLGTESPTSLLTTSGGDIRILGSGNRLRFNTNGSIYWDSSAGVKLENASTEDITIETNTSGDIFFNTGNTRAMSVQTDNKVFIGDNVQNQSLAFGGTLKTHQYLDTRDYMQHKGHFAESDWIVMESGANHVVTSYFDNTNVYVDGVYKAKIDSAFGQATISSSDLSLGSVISADRAVVVHQSGTIRSMCMNERFSGRLLGSGSTRGYPLTIHIYAPYTSVSYSIYRSSSANVDITATALTTGTISQGGIITFTESDTASGTQYYVIEADGKVCATLDDGAQDHLLFTPLAMEVIASSFSRENRGGITDAAGSTSISETQNDTHAYYLKDTTGKYGLFATGVADGAGSEAEFAMPIEFCSDYYIYGDPELSNYRLVCFQDTFVKVLDVNGNVLYTHDGSLATKHAPLYFDNGTATGSGTLSTAGPFRFVGTAPFQLVCQEPGGQDETTMLGAMQHELSNNQRFKGGAVPNNVVLPSDNQKLIIGANSDLELYAHDPANDSRINVNNNPLLITYNGADRFRLASTDLVINEGGGDYNFKVEGDTDANLLFVDAGTNRVGIGTSTPESKLNIVDSGETIIRLYASTASTRSGIWFTNGSYSYGTNIGTDNKFHITGNINSEGELVTIDSSGNLGIGVTSPGYKLDVNGTSGLRDNVTIFDDKTLYVGNDLTNGLRIFHLSSNNNNYIRSNGGALSVQTIAAQPLYLVTNNTTAMTIDSSQDVKIEESLGIGVAASSTTGRLDCSNDVIAYSTSDKRLKENIKPLDSALDKVLKINGVEFDWKELTEKEKKTIHGNEGHDVGVIAQEIEEILPEVVTTRDNGYKAVKYEKIVPLLIEAIKEQQKQIEELKNG